MFLIWFTDCKKQTNNHVVGISAAGGKCFGNVCKGVHRLTVSGMDPFSKDNANPLVHESTIPRTRAENEDEDVHDEFDAREVFDLLRDINDPEHPLTLEDLRVVNEKDIYVDDNANIVRVAFTPTIPHCSMATLIGLAIRVRLIRALPSRFKVEIRIAEGTHQSEAAVNKQLADKERVAAALENRHLLGVVNQCLTMKN